MVLDADGFERALQDAQRIGVVVDAADDRGLVFHADPTTLSEPVDGASGAGVPLMEAVLVGDVLAVGVLAQELVGMVEVDHQPERNLGVDFVEAVDHAEEGIVKSVGIEGQLLGSDADCLDSGLSQCSEPRRQLGVWQHHRIAA